MSKDKEKIREQLFGLDDVVTDGVYCVAPTEEDMKVFREHARKRKEQLEKKMKK